MKLAEWGNLFQPGFTLVKTFCHVDSYSECVFIQEVSGIFQKKKKKIREIQYISAYQEVDFFDSRDFPISFTSCVWSYCVKSMV